MESKVIVITGGTSGIGFACAEYLISRNYTVVITGRTKSTLEVAVSKLGSQGIGILSDTSSLRDIDALVEEVKKRVNKIDGLFINAGIFKSISFEETTEELYAETMNINFKGAFFTVQKFIPILKNALNTTMEVLKTILEGFFRIGMKPSKIY
ncbi:MAG: SDR family NAD(P)-dependent oxidoreductase [Bacteroidota bacterium]